MNNTLPSRPPPCTRTDDEYFCPLDGGIFTCTGGVYVTQQDMDKGKINHNIKVSAKPIYSDDIVEGYYHLHLPLEGKSGILIGGFCTRFHQYPAYFRSDLTCSVGVLCHDKPSS